MMQMGFSEEEYERVRAWLLSVFEREGAAFDEAEMLEMLRENKWYLVTGDRFAAVLELFKFEGEWIANILLLGGEKNNSLKEILRCQGVFCRFLKDQGFVKLVGTPRREWHKLILKHGFEKQEEEFIKRL